MRLWRDIVFLRVFSTFAASREIFFLSDVEPGLTGGVLNERVRCRGLDWRWLDKGPPVSSINDVKVDISVVLGKATLPMQQLLRMGRGAVIELDAKQTDQVWILANNKPIARGEIMVQGDKIAISVTDTLKSTG